MNYVPWVVAAAISAGAWAYTFSLGGYTTRTALTLGVYGHYAATTAGYRPGSASWARAQMLQRNPDHAVRDPAATYADLIDAPAVQLPDREHKRGHRQFTHVPIYLVVPDDATDEDVSAMADVLRAAEALRTVAPDWTATTPAVGIAAVPDPTLDVDGSVAVQHAVDLPADDSFGQLADMTETGEYQNPWAGVDRLLANWEHNTNQINLGARGWNTGQWRAFEQERTPA